MKSFFHAVAFLTRVPVPLSGDEKDWKKSPMWYPIVGFFLGGLFISFDSLLASCFPDAIRAGFDLAFWVWMTGGLHLDGLMDTADGLLSHRGRERALEIMKDSRVGAMGVIAGVLFLLLKWLALQELITRGTDVFTAGWVSACVMGRFAAVIGMFTFPYVRPKGMGAGMKETLSPLRFGWALMTAMVPVGAFLGFWGLLLSLVSLAAVCAFAWCVSRRLGGLTGDVYGAMIEGTELLALLLLTVKGGGPFADFMASSW